MAIERDTSIVTRLQGLNLPSLLLSMSRRSLHFALVVVGERLVRRPQVLEPLVGVGVIGVAVRVHFLGQLAVRLLDLVLVGIATHTEDLVEVTPAGTTELIRLSPKAKSSPVTKELVK